MNITENPKKKYSLFALISELPGLVIELIKSEIAHAKTELSRKFKIIGIGVGFFAGAAVVGFWLVAVLITAAILGLAVVFPPWLAALIIAGVLIIVIGVLVLLGVKRFKNGFPPTPDKTVESVKKDVRAVKGIGEYDYED